MAQLGLDPEQMTALQKVMQRDAGAIRTMTKEIDSQLRGAWWKGADADKFRGEWDGTHKGQLNNIATQLEAQAKAIQKNITQQTQASGS